MVGLKHPLAHFIPTSLGWTKDSTKLHDEIKLEDQENEQKNDEGKTWYSCLIEREQLMRSKRIRARLIVDVERSSNKKLRNGWKRIEKAVNRENAKCKEWIMHNLNHKPVAKGLKLQELRTEHEEAEKRLLSSETQCIRKSGIGLATLSWRRRLDRKGETQKLGNG